MFAVGKEVGLRTLKKTYDSRVLDVLGRKLEKICKKGSSSFTVKEELPNLEEYKKLKILKYTTNVTSLIEDAYSEIESLRDEIDEWLNSIPENLQGGDKGQQLEELLGYLEDIQIPDIPESVDVSVYFEPSLELSSKSSRSAEAAIMLETAKDALQDAIENIETKVNSDEKIETLEENPPEILSEMEDLISSLEEDIDRINDLTFPGMF